MVMLIDHAELDRNSYKPLYIQLSEILIEHANDSHLEHGDALPSQNELLSRFDVSRNTVRLAVDRLVELGVAKKIKGQGTFYVNEKRTMSVNWLHAFEASLKRMGLKITNKLIDKKTTSGRVRWIAGLGTTQWDETVWLRRLKLAADEIIAIEERLLPRFVAKRFSQREIENGIFIDLVEQYPDTQITRFNYNFCSHPLTKEEAHTLKLPPEMNYMRRIGEYYNSVNERFMLSRLTVISDQVNLGYHCSKQDGNWVLQE